MIGRRTEDELLRAATAMLAWGTGAAASFAAALLLQVGPAVGAALVAAGATCAAAAVAAYVRAARTARASAA